MDPVTAVEGEQRKGAAPYSNDTTCSTPSAARALSGLAGGSGGPVGTGEDTEEVSRPVRISCDERTPQITCQHWQRAQENAQGHQSMRAEDETRLRRAGEPLQV
jgi:hypothetical protein